MLTAGKEADALYLLVWSAKARRHMPESEHGPKDSMGGSIPTTAGDPFLALSVSPPPTREEQEAH